MTLEASNWVPSAPLPEKSGSIQLTWHHERPGFQKTCPPDLFVVVGESFPALVRSTSQASPNSGVPFANLAMCGFTIPLNHDEIPFKSCEISSESHRITLKCTFRHGKVEPTVVSPLPNQGSYTNLPWSRPPSRRQARRCTAHRRPSCSTWFACPNFVETWAQGARNDGWLNVYAQENGVLYRYIDIYIYISCIFMKYCGCMIRFG